MSERESLREARDWLAEVEGCDMTPVVERAQRIIQHLVVRAHESESALAEIAEFVDSPGRPILALIAKEALDGLR